MYEFIGFLKWVAVIFWITPGILCLHRLFKVEPGEKARKNRGVWMVLVLLFLGMAALYDFGC